MTGKLKSNTTFWHLWQVITVYELKFENKDFVSTWRLFIHRMLCLSVSARITIFCLFNILSIAVINSLLIIVLEFCERWLFCMSGLLWPWEDSLLPSINWTSSCFYLPKYWSYFSCLIDLKGTLRDLTKAGRIAFEQNELVFLMFFIVMEQFLFSHSHTSPIVNNQDLNIVSSCFMSKRVDKFI